MSTLWNSPSRMEGVLFGLGCSALLLVGMLIGAAIQYWKLDGVKADLAANQIKAARTRAAAAEAGSRRLQDAVKRSNLLEKALADSEAQLRKLSEEQRNAVKPHTTGRACLSAGAVRVLNAEPGNASATLPATVGVAASSSSGAAADPDVAEEEVATDSDISGWVITAKEQYGVCRQRLQRLIDWFVPDATQPPQPNE